MLQCPDLTHLMGLIALIALIPSGGCLVASGRGECEGVGPAGVLAPPHMSGSCAAPWASEVFRPRPILPLRAPAPPTLFPLRSIRATGATAFFGVSPSPRPDRSHSGTHWGSRWAPVKVEIGRDQAENFSGVAQGAAQRLGRVWGQLERRSWRGGAGKGFFPPFQHAFFPVSNMASSSFSDRPRRRRSPAGRRPVEGTRGGGRAARRPVLVC